LATLTEDLQKGGTENNNPFLGQLLSLENRLAADPFSLNLFRSLHKASLQYLDILDLDGARFQDESKPVIVLQVLEGDSIISLRYYTNRLTDRLEIEVIDPSSSDDEGSKTAYIVGMLEMGKYLKQD